MPNWEGGAQGAAAGASAGAIFGPWGAAIGGVGGGLLGAFGGGGGPSERELQMMQFEREVAGRQTPQIGQDSSSFRNAQSDLVSRLQAMASGSGPSLAQEQLRQGVDRATSQQYAMAAGARGNAGLAQRNAMNTAGMLQSQAAQQGAMAGAAEQLGALSQLGSAAGQGRSMDNQISLANQSAMLQAEQMRDASRLQAMGRGFDMSAYNAQQPTIVDKLGAAAVGYGQMRANQRGGAQSPQTARPYGDNTINPFQAY